MKSKRTHLTRFSSRLKAAKTKQPNQLKRAASTGGRRALLREIDPLLDKVYRRPKHGNFRDPTTELFYLLLTVKSRISDALPKLKELKMQVLTWNNLPDVSPESIRPILDPLGFGTKRSQILIQVAKRVRQDFGRVNLLILRRKSKDEALDYLRSLPFVGEKVARCVALYSLDVDVSPMDANSTRVLSRIGVLPHKIEAKQAHPWIDKLIDEGASYRLHVNLLAHGQRCCVPRSPKCHQCPVAHLCRHHKRKPTHSTRPNNLA